MDFILDLDEMSQSTQDLASLEVGDWEDLEHLVKLLNGAWESREYKLEKVAGKRGMWLFIEDVLSEDEYACGIVERHKGKAIAFSPAVHAMIMGAYQAYVDEFGDPMLA